MSILRMILGLVLMVFIIGACSDDDTQQPNPDPVPLETTDDLLVRLCELGGQCGSSTPDQIDQCPGDLLLELDVDDLRALEVFLTLEDTEQNRILECFAVAVCGRFGGSVLNMSDSDVMETLHGCD